MKTNAQMHPTTLLIRDGEEYRDFDLDEIRSDRSTDSVSADPKQYSSAPTNFSVSTSTGDILTLAAGEKAFIQNLGTVAIKVKKGSGAAANSFSFGIKAGTVEDDMT